MTAEHENHVSNKISSKISSMKSILNSSDCLYTMDEINNVISDLATLINQKMASKNPIVLTIMNGGLVFAGQLLPQLDFNLEVDYCHVSRYRNSEQGEELLWKALPQLDVTNRHVLVLDDILDEGHTLLAIIKSLQKNKAQSVSTAVLVNKEHDRKADINFKADFVGLNVPDKFVYGFGMDMHGICRNAPGIYVTKS